MEKQKNGVGTILKIILTVALIWIGIFSVWFTTNIYNKENFINSATTAFKSESFRTTLSKEVVVRLSEQYPILGRVAGPTLESVISGITGAEFMNNVYAFAADRAYTQLLTNESTAIVIDLRRVNDFLEPLLTALDSEVGERLEQIPDRIVLLDENRLPNISAAASVIVNFGRATGLLGIILLVYFIYKTPKKLRLDFAKKLGITVAAFAALSFLAVSTIRDYLLSIPNSESARVLISELFKNMTHDLSNVSVVLFFTGLILIIIPSFVGRLKKPK